MKKRKTANTSSFRIDKTALSTAPLFDESDIKAYWLSTSSRERLRQIEILRRINYGHRATARLAEFLRLLNVHKVEYLLIGGYAVGYHGYPRATQDMDIWIAIHPKNAKRVVAALREFGFDMPELSPDLFLQDQRIVRMGVPPLRIEIATAISGVHFKECYRKRVTDVIDGIKVNFISLRHLKINKKASGRHRDLDDLEHLP